MYMLTQTIFFTVSHLDGLADPESSSLITYPLTRSYNLGIKIDF